MPAATPRPDVTSCRANRLHHRSWGASWIAMPGQHAHGMSRMNSNLRRARVVRRTRRHGSLPLQKGQFQLSPRELLPRGWLQSIAPCLSSASFAPSMPVPVQSHKMLDSFDLFRSMLALTPLEPQKASFARLILTCQSLVCECRVRGGQPGQPNELRKRHRLRSSAARNRGRRGTST